MKLYWAAMEDYDEDWFIFASSSEEAKKWKTMKQLTQRQKKSWIFRKTLLLDSQDSA
jgi:hypothetical protein